MENNITFSQFIAYLADLGLPVWAGAITGIAVFVLEIILAKRGIILSNQEKKIEKAKSLGNVITADTIHRSYKRRGNKNTLYSSVYEYTVNGKKKKYVIVSNGYYPPETISLYYTSNPNKVFSEYDNDKRDIIQWLLMYIIPILAMALVMFALGFKPEQ